MALKVPVYTQQVGTTPLPAPLAPSSVPSGVAALGEGLSSLGADVAAVAHEKQARDDQTAVFNGVSGGRIAADTGIEAWDRMAGQAKLDAAPSVLEDFDSWVSDTRSGMTPDQQRGFDMQIASVREDVRSTVAREEAGLRLSLANQSLASVVQSFTGSAALKASKGRLFLSETPSSPNAPPQLGGTHGALFIVGGDQEREKIESAIRAHFATYGQARFGSQAIVAEDEAIGLAVSELHTARLNAILTPQADVPIDHNLARAYFDRYETEIDTEGGDNRDAMREDVARAWQTGETARVSVDIFDKHRNTDATWNEREKAMLADAKKAPETIRADVETELRQQVSIAQADERTTRAATAVELQKAIRNGVPLRRIIASAPYGSLRDEPDLQDAIVTYGNAWARGEYAVTDDDLYETLTMQAVHDPAAFLDQNVDKYSMEQRLSESDASHFRAWQKVTLDRLAGSQQQPAGILSPEEVITQSASEMYGSGDASRKKRGQYLRAADALYAEFKARNGRIPTTQETQEQIVDVLNAQIVTEAGFFGDTTIRAGEDIPPEELVEIVQFLARKGRDVTPEEIAFWWREEHIPKPKPDE